MYATHTKGKKITNIQVSKLLTTSINVKIKSIKESFLPELDTFYFLLNVHLSHRLCPKQLPQPCLSNIQDNSFYLYCFLVDQYMTLCFKRTVRKVEGKEAASTIFSILSNHFLDLILDSRLPKGRQPCKVLEVRFHRGIISVQLHDEDTYPEPSKNRTSHCAAITAL